MNTFRTDVNAWLQSRPHVTTGRSFPFGDYSCTPLLCDEEDCDSGRHPTAFLLSRGKCIEVIEREGPNHHLWESLVREMEHWHIHTDTEPAAPPECWYG